jgi:hypothetical protein
MKPSIAILYVLVSLCLAISITTLAIVATDHGFLAPAKPTNMPTPNPTLSFSTPPSTTPPTPTSTDAPIPSPTPFSSTDGLTLTYKPPTKEDLPTGVSKVNYTITATYAGNGEVTINYSDFFLELSVWRMVYQFNEGTTPPQNSGTITLNPSHPLQTFELHFVISTKTSNGMDDVTTQYGLNFKGAATLQDASITP